MRPLSPESWNAFEQHLHETRVWCSYIVKETKKRDHPVIGQVDVSPGIHPSRYGWSPELNPAINIREISLAWTQIHSGLEIVQKKRQSQIAKLETSFSELELNGRLLVCRFENCLWDTAPQWTSDGFFNEGDYPPWDTWIEWLEEDNIAHPTEPHHALLCWIPEDWWSVASMGINASPTYTNAWLSELQDGLAVQMREKGLIA